MNKNDLTKRLNEKLERCTYKCITEGFAIVGKAKLVTTSFMEDGEYPVEVHKFVDGVYYDKISAVIVIKGNN